MPATIRQQIIDAVKARFEAITVVNGYNYDLGSNVTEWKTVNHDEASLPALVFRDINEDSEPGPHPAYINDLRMQVEIKTEEGATTSSAIRKMIADVIKVIGTDVQWSTLALNTILEGNRIEIYQTEKIIGGAEISFMIRYRTNAFDPYTQI